MFLPTIDHIVHFLSIVDHPRAALSLPPGNNSTKQGYACGNINHQIRVCMWYHQPTKVPNPRKLQHIVSRPQSNCTQIVHALLYTCRPSSYATTSRASYSVGHRSSQSPMTLGLLANFRAF